jgi:hypothetical protein
LRKFLILLIFALPLLLYLPHLADFSAPYRMAESDMIGSHFPNAVFLRQSLAQWGQIPLWSDTILGGYPFAANPLSGLWYPPGWLMVVLDLPLAFNLAILLHLLLGGLGMYRFLRAEGCDLFPALLGGLVFELMPRLFGHYAAGHVTLLYALCWTPWLLWAEKVRALRGGVAPALVFGVALLASLPGAAYGGLLWAFYSFSLALPRLKNPGWAGRIRSCLRWAAGFLGQVGLAALFAAPFLLLFFEYAALSNRFLLTSADTLLFSLPPLQLPGLFIPNFGAFPEWVIYPGAFAFCILVCSVLLPALRRRVGLWLGILLFGILAALGENFPPTAWLFNLPGFSALRVPARMMFLAGFAFAVLAAAGLQAWKEAPFANRSQQRRVALGLLLPALTAGLLLASVWSGSGEFPTEFAWGFAALCLAALLLWLRGRQRIGYGLFAGLAALLTVIDLAGVGFAQFNFRRAQEVLADGNRAPDFLAAADLPDGGGRIYSPTLSIPQQRAAVLGLELAGGVDPLHLQSYVDYFSRASGIPVTVYSVTLPPLPLQNGLSDYRAAPLDTTLLGRMNVTYLVSEYPLESPGLEWLQTLDGLYLYRSQNALPRAWVQADATTFELLRAVDSLQRSPNQIELQANGPGVLVLSESAYPGWQVAVDGQPAELLTIDGLLRGVELSPAAHSVTFSFRPPWLAVGGALQALAILAVLLYWRLRSRNKGGLHA